MKRTTSLSTERRSSASASAQSTLEKGSIRARGWTIARLAVVTIFFTAAPTAGDIGSCGQAPDDLDPVKFYTAKEQLDCKKCIACDLTTDACVRACEPELDVANFPLSCFPLVHDGEVCLHALEVSSCDDYTLFMSDVAPTIPTECNFCPPCDDGGVPDGAGVNLPRCE